MDVSDILVATAGEQFDEDIFEGSPIRNILKTYFFNVKYNLSVGTDLNVQRNNLILKDLWLTNLLGDTKMTFFEDRIGQPYIGSVKTDLYDHFTMFVQRAN